MESAFWDILGRKPALVFGRECGSATIWMLSILVQRTLIWLLRLDAFLPYGIIFAFPFLAQILAQYIPFLQYSYPLLPVRLAESILGRISPSILAVIVPAHFLGCLVAIVVFKTILPIVPLQVFEPIIYSQHDSSWLTGLVTEIIVVFMYIVTILVLPAILEVNKLNSRLLSIPTLPLMLFCRAPDKTITFNPAAVYALWYVNRNVFGSSTGNFNPLQLEHLIGPILGSVLAGLFCNYAFPDDPTTWIRTSSSKKFV